MFWNFTYRDIKAQSKLKLGFELAKASQDFQNFATVVNYALGGKPKEAEKAEAPANMSVAQRQLAAVLGKG